MITQTITALPTPPNPATDDSATFQSRASAFTLALVTMGTEVNTLASQANLLVGQLNSLAGVSMVFNFDTTIANSDPGNGLFRLNSATQNTATAAYIDLVDANGRTVSSIIDLFDDSTSTHKGYLVLRSSATMTNWAIFSVTGAVGSPTGYKSLVLTPAAWSAINPFANGEQVIMSFVRTGDIATGTVSNTDLQTSNYVAATTAGTSSAFTLTPSPALGAYAANVRFFVTFNAACADNATINISGLGAINLVKQLSDGSYTNVRAGDIMANHRSRVSLLNTTQALVETVARTSDITGALNRVINSGCVHAQAGAITLANNTTAYGGADCYLSNVAGTTLTSGTLTAAAGLGAGSTITGCAQKIQGVTTTGSTTIMFAQRLESRVVLDMNSRTVTFKGKVVQGSGSTLNVVPQIYKANSLDNFGAVTLVATGPSISVPNGVWTEFSMTVTLGAADATNGLELRASYSSVAAQTNTDWYTGDWMFYIGNYTSQVERQSFGKDFADCARYYYVTNYGVPKGAAAGAHGGIAVNTSTVMAPLKYPVPMRVVPTLTLWNNGTQNQVRDTVATTGVGVTGVSAFGSSNNSGFSYIQTSGTALTANKIYDFDIVADARL